MPAAACLAGQASAMSSFRRRRTDTSTPKLEIAMTKQFIGVLAAAMVALGALPASAQVTSQVGTLSCDVSEGIGMILVEKQTLSCVFTSNKTNATENYTGSIDQFGVELGEIK